MEMKSEASITRLSIQSDLGKQDLHDATLKLEGLGPDGELALKAMKGLAAAIETLEGSVNLFSLVLSTDVNPRSLNCRLEFSLSVKDPITVSSDAMVREVLDLSTRARKVMVRGGIETIGELEAMTADQLREIKLCGTNTLRDIETALAKVGKKLAV